VSGYSKTYTIDYDQLGDTVYEAVDKTDDNIDSIVTWVNNLKKSYASASAPTSPAPDEGQLWWDSANDILMAYDGSNWAELKVGRLPDTDDSHDLSLVWNEDDTAGRTLNLLVKGGSRSLTLNEDFTIGDGAGGTLTYSTGGKTLTVENNSNVNQDLTTDASPTFVNTTLTALTTSKPVLTDGTGKLTSTVNQDIDMNTHKLTGLSAPSSNGDSIRATTKITEANLEDAVDKKHSQNTDQYLDYGGANQCAVADVKDAINKKHAQNADTALGVQTQDLDMGTHKVVNVVDPVADQDVATKKYVNDNTGGGPVVIWPWAYKTIIQGSWTFYTNSDYFSGIIYYSASHNNGDEIHYNVYLAAGTYKIWLIGARDSDRGIMDIYIDDTEVASFDMYGASAPKKIWSDSGNVVSVSGLKTIKIKADGKNADSSNYTLAPSAIIFERTA